MSTHVPTNDEAAKPTASAGNSSSRLATSAPNGTLTTPIATSSKSEPGAHHESPQGGHAADGTSPTTPSGRVSDSQDHQEGAGGSQDSVGPGESGSKPIDHYMQSQGPWSTWNLRKSG